VAWPQPPPLPEADVTVKAANANTQAPVPPDAANDMTTIVPMTRPPLTRTASITSDVSRDDTVREDRTTDTIDVTLSRETATFTVPVSEAHLPQSLHAALAKAKSLAGSPATETQSLLVSKIDNSDVLDAIPAETELTARDLALIGRMAPQAAE
jgi:hypothetical protein